MRRVAVASAVLAVAALAACSREARMPTDEDALVAGPEASLAASLAGTADSIAQRERNTMGLIVQAFFNALRQSDNPGARALVEQSRALADSGRTAAQAGDRETARRYFEAAHEALFDAVVLVLPNVNQRLAASVDTIRARALARLDTAVAPHIRRVLGFVAELRGRADAALAAGDAGKALTLNVRAMETLRMMHRHLQRPGGPGLPGDQGVNPPPDGVRP
jgi:tetratricopeptide (TPR) repeat protein